MSDPLPAAQPPSGHAPARSGAARWLDRLTGALLLAAAASVTAAAAPAALRALGTGGAPPQSVARMPRVRTPAPPPSRRFAFDLDDEEDDRAVDPHRLPGDDDPGAEPGGGGGLRAGLARRDLKVLGEPAPDGAPVGEIRAGQMVMIMKEAGEWALVVQSGEDGVVMGWARRSEIAVR